MKISPRYSHAYALLIEAFSFLLYSCCWTLKANMSLLSLLLLQNLFHFGQTLVSCNETVSELQLCTLVSAYDEGTPDVILQTSGQPTQVISSVTLFSVAEFNEDQRTITLNVLLSFWWNDTRLTLTPKGFDE